MKYKSRRFYKQLFKIRNKFNTFLFSKIGLLGSGTKIQQRVLKYCKAMKGSNSGHFKYSIDCPETVWASAFAALILNLIGQLKKMSEHEKSSWIRYFQSFQDEKTGYFLDPKYRDVDRKSLIHSNELFFAHSSTFIMGALVILGGKPIYPIKWVHEFREPIKMKKWIESRPWDVNPWVVGNWSYDMGCAMGMDYLVTKDERNLEAMDAYFEWYDKHQLKETGWWDLSGKAPVKYQQYGGSHILIVYYMFDRPIPMAERMIDSSLLLQSDDGMFAEERGGGCCQDMDVIDTLVSLGLAKGYKENNIRLALERALPAILCKQNVDGGFYDNLRRSRSEFGWKLCTSKAGESDLCSTLFQCFNIALIGEFLNNKKIMSVTWHHHGTYCHCVRRKIKLK